MKNEKIKIIFVGTPAFAVPSLRAIAGNDKLAIQAVVTKADKKVGRRQEMKEPEIKTVAKEYGYKIFQPSHIREIENDIRELAPDIMVVAAYAHIIPEAILKLPKLGCVNIHGSLLPSYRGSACIQSAILNNDKETGVTFMLMDKGLDTGPVLKQYRINIGDKETAGDIYRRLSVLAADNICHVLLAFSKGQISPVAQNKEISTATKQLIKDDGRINWGQDSAYIGRFIRAMTPWPGAFSFFINKKNNKKLRLQILSAENKSGNKPDIISGTLYSLNERLWAVGGNGIIEILELKLEGKKKISAHEFISGYGKLLPIKLF